ncbi:hypothetical protein E3983_03665 [Legionella israelensis]|uniref:Secreted protein n=1 Tax=Legionella israelensis TaxID=454 RepID=A0A0W0WIB5_9GAMM|nr:hypothetical protein [Legionella israelensis]KTD32048.1 hypothetical protein Lisr_0521 [Legionella israelensis]QBR83533.1 hypothetical protein E3983_03665 [Legionella israelensis]QBS09091.1 hypothetical protein E4T55_04010 [Legionella israelensis]QDP72069.1 hypothetical protein FOG18_05540 [Legionella israelensis]SCY08976.1 hypothetical protein SAMN02746069_01251 [Legionella israelensis DSM 19235]
MKLKTFLLICCFSLASNLFAANLHKHPKADDPASKPAEKKLMSPGYCEIEIINDSYDNVSVHGTFDDGTYVDFTVYRYEAPHYISLYYYGYCHPDMYLDIYTPYAKIYSGYTRVNSTVRIVPYLKNQAKASISAR